MLHTSSCAEITTNFFSIHADIFSYAHAFYPNSSWHDIYRHSNSTLFLLLLDLTILQPVNQWPLQLKSDLQHFSLKECLQKKTLLPTLYDWRIDDNELASQSVKYRAYTLAGKKLKEELFYATTIWETKQLGSSTGFPAVEMYLYECRR